MHDCRSQGGHFFVYRPQNHPFRCRRCTERFVSSYTDQRLKHPWKCLIERCEYVACGPCSDILAGELAIRLPAAPAGEEALLQSLSMKDVKVLPETVAPSQKKTGMLRRAVAEFGGPRDPIARDVPKKMPPRAAVGAAAGEKPKDVPGLGKIEVDDDSEDPYCIPVFARTARQAAAQAVLRRTHVKLRPVTRRGAEVSDV